MLIMFSGRSDRYNHEVSDGDDTEDDTDDSMFHSFSACSPRYSKVYMKFEELREVQLQLTLDIVDSVMFSFRCF